MMRTSAAPSAHDGSSASAVIRVRAALCARSSRDSSRVDCICIRTVRNAPNATNATARPTAIVVRPITRLASERR